MAEHKVVLEKKTEDEKLGAAVIYSNKVTLTIKAFKETGLIVDYNKSLMGGSDLPPMMLGDVIFDVNGVSGDAQAMMEQLKPLGKVTLTFKRQELPAEPAAEPASAEPASAEPVKEEQKEEEVIPVEPAPAPAVTEKPAVSTEAEIPVQNEEAEMQPEPPQVCGCF